VPRDIGYYFVQVSFFPPQPTAGGRWRTGPWTIYLIAGLDRESRTSKLSPCLVLKLCGYIKANHGLMWRSCNRSHTESELLRSTQLVLNLAQGSVLFWGASSPPFFMESLGVDLNGEGKQIRSLIGRAPISEERGTTQTRP